MSTGHQPQFEPAASRATIKDVAAAAAVSVATVSKVFTGGYRIRPETERRVRQAAADLNFVPNPYARSLHGGSTGTVGMITSDLDGRFSIPVMMGAEDAFGTGEVSVFLCDARGDAIREQHHLRALLTRRVDGLIIVGSTTNPRSPITADPPVPVVYAYSPSDNETDTSVTPDNVEAGSIAAGHLLSLGRRKIGYISGDDAFLAASERVRGAEEALHAHGLELLGGSALFGTWGEEWGRAGARQLLQRHPEIDGILCGSDNVARGALDALREDGIRVPDQVSVVGHDNWELLATQARPTLTSVENNLEEVGRIAAQLLFAAIEGDKRPGVHRVGTRLVPRGSTLSPR